MRTLTLADGRTINLYDDEEPVATVPEEKIPQEIKKVAPKVQRQRNPQGRRKKKFDLEKAQALRNSGLSFRDIAQKMSGVSYRTLARHLRQEGESL